MQRHVVVIGMKGFGGIKRAMLHRLVNAEKVVRYALSYPDVCPHLISMVWMMSALSAKPLRQRAKHS